MTSRHLASRSLLFTAFSLAASQAFAAIPVGEHFSLSGFGTVAALRTDTDDAAYIRESQTKGATDSFNLGTDSNFGVQLTGRANSWLSATVQTLTKRRSALYGATQVEWMFVKIEPFEGLAIRGGRIATPTFAISDTRNIGYANPWVHAPSEVYGLAVIDQLRGGDITYSHDLGGGTLKVTGLAGKNYFAADVGTGPLALKQDNVLGVNAVWENDWLMLRAGQVKGDFDLPAFADYGDQYTFTGFGAIFNRDNWLIQGEYVTRRAKNIAEQADIDGWYALVGHRFGAVQPFASYGSSEPKYSASRTGKQTTASLGVRWDFYQSMALKAQWDKVDTNGIGNSFNRFRPGFDGNVNVFVVALDFVF
ncbi:hypothetical protein [Xanthomonas sp. 3058]|nr:hypothetical protein [Xanthomonas sp. 3058]MBB5863496.1 hypothetical protein [Xanthomonas sp. 3058]